jgi:hypothetical protein
MAVLLVGEDMVAPQWGEHRAITFTFDEQTVRNGDTTPPFP